MRKYYIVICLSVGGLGNKVFRSGDSVTDANFPPGNADRLVKEGFLKNDDEKNELELENSTKGKVNSGDAVTEADELAMKAAEEKLVAPVSENDNPNGNESLLDQLKGAAGVKEKGVNVSPKSIDELTKGEMKAYLDFKDIQYNPHSNKEELYKIWVANQ